MATEANPFCENCRHWDTSASSMFNPDDTGQCRRNPPHPDFRTSLAIWPFTESRDRCGEHSPIIPSEV